MTLPVWWPLLAIPLINGLVGWITNALAIRMLFGPIERIGVGVVGWQGVIPAHAERMAGIKDQDQGSDPWSSSFQK